MAAEFLNGYELIGDWKNSSCGKTAKAKKGGKTYFLKKYQTPVQPVDNGAIDAKTFAQNKELFDDFYNTRKRINTTIRPLAGPGGNIIIPSSEFISGNQYVEAAEFVEGVVPDDELERVLATLSIETKKLLMQTAAGALFTIHSKGIVHSDLKLKNVLLAKTRSGNYVAKLIDFDSSYFVDKKYSLVCRKAMFERWIRSRGSLVFPDRVRSRPPALERRSPRVWKRSPQEPVSRCFWMVRRIPLPLVFLGCRRR